MVEGARLEIVYTSKGYPGFESLSIRQLQKEHPCGAFFVTDEDCWVLNPGEKGSTANERRAEARR